MKEDRILYEATGTTFIGTLVGKSFHFISLESNLGEVSALKNFIYWASYGWQGFYEYLPEKLREWMDRHIAESVAPTKYASRIYRKMTGREQEIITGMVNFAKYDQDLFPDPKRLFSIN